MSHWARLVAASSPAPTDGVVHRAGAVLGAMLPVSWPSFFGLLLLSLTGIAELPSGHGAGRLIRPTGDQALFHTVFPVECKGGYLLWQTIGLWYSFRKVNMPGSFTRLLACAEEDRESFRRSGGMDVCPTHITPSYTNYHKGDSYGPYNMGGTILHWVSHAQPKEDYVLILDSDMVLLRPVLPAELGLGPGQAHAAFYGYLKGVNNDLAIRQVPEIQPRNDTNAGPRGRRGDQVGGVQSMTMRDLRRVAPLWLKYTERVREDPLAWKDTGDVYVREGEKPWISEMYGYSFGCAKADVWHRANFTLMLYPEYPPTDFPTVMHYGLLFNIFKYQFDKHWHYGFDPLRCPPWEHGPNPRSINGGVLPPPPHPSTLPAGLRGWPLLQHLYAATTVAILNEAFCELHLKRCPQLQLVQEVCNEAIQLAKDIAEAIKAAEQDLHDNGSPCVDEQANCNSWASIGECVKNPGYMRKACPVSCGLCKQKTPPPAKSSFRETMQDAKAIEASTHSSVNVEHKAASKAAPPEIDVQLPDLVEVALSEEVGDQTYDQTKEDGAGGASGLLFSISALWLSGLVGAGLYLQFQLRKQSRRRRVLSRSTLSPLNKAALSP